MAETAPPAHPLDLSFVTDSDVRRALRAIHQQAMEILDRQQLQIEAIIETLIEKHVTSMGEFKRQLLKLQQGGARVERLVGQLATAVPAKPTPPRA